jgi:hypothetical protein
MMGIGWVWHKGEWKLAFESTEVTSVFFVDGGTAKNHEVVYGPFEKIPERPSKEPSFGERIAGRIIL